MSTAPIVHDYASALDFLRHAFLDGAGEFGFSNHVVAEHDGTVVAAGAAWGRRGEISAAMAAAGVPAATCRLVPSGSVTVIILRLVSLAQDRSGFWWKGGGLP